MSIDDVWNNAVARQLSQRSSTLYKDGTLVMRTGNMQTSSTQLTNKQYMDLISAQREAKEKSAAEKKKLYFINIDDDGESSITNLFDRDTSAYCYKGGNEVALPAVEIATPTKAAIKGTKTNQSTKKVATTNAVMATVATKKTGKVVAKKVAAKGKSAKKAVKRTVSAELAEIHKRRTAGGKRMDITIGQMEKNTKAGKVFYKDPQGVRQTLDGFKARANKEFVRKGMFEFKVVAEK